MANKDDDKLGYFGYIDRLKKQVGQLQTIAQNAEIHTYIHLTQLGVLVAEFANLKLVFNSHDGVADAMRTDVDGTTFFMVVIPSGAPYDKNGINDTFGDCKTIVETIGEKLAESTMGRITMDTGDDGGVYLARDTVLQKFIVPIRYKTNH